MTTPLDRGTPGQIRATRALLKFCREHLHTQYWIASLEECLAALEHKQGDTVREIYERFSRAGMGSYHDWYPEVAFPNEDPEYAETLWFGLNSYWNEMMRPYRSKHR